MNLITKNHSSILLRFGGALFLLVLLAHSTSAQPHSAEGIIEIAPSPYASAATHVLRPDHGSPILLALNDPRGLLQPNPFSRIRIIGDPAPDRIANDLPLVEVTEVRPAQWSFPDTRRCAPSIASWAGCASSLYAGLANAPLPRGPTFTGSFIPSPDSDGDGVPDDLDAFPNDPTETTDTDQDGIGNNADLDDDGDGMPDTYEMEHGLNPLVNDARLDLDRDGVSNLDEYLAGTAADDPKSLFRVQALKIVRGTLNLSFLSVPGRIYVIYAAAAADGRFVRASESIQATDTLTSVSLPPDPRIPTTFYQIQVLPQ